MYIEVDTCGLACPQPVISVKKALDDSTVSSITAIADNVVAKENILKFVAANGCRASVNEENSRFRITIIKDGTAVNPAVSAQTAPTIRRVYLIGSATLGQGSAELGAVLMKSFIFTVLEKQPLPATVMFINSGVKMALQGSPVLEHLKALESQGVQILSCGTCLDYYNVKDQLAVGVVTNMYTILDELTAADQTITV